MRFLSYLVTPLVAFLLASCGGGGGSPGTVSGSGGSSADFFTTAPSALTLTLGAAQDFGIGGGTAPYSAVSADTSVVVGGVAGSTLTLGGVRPGTATITVRDSKGATKDVTVTVQPARTFFTTAPADLTLAIGNAGAQVYQVGGGVAPYTVVSTNPSALSAVLTPTAAGANLTLTGLSAGSANAVLTDSTGAQLTSKVAVSAATTVALFTTAPGTGVTIAKGGVATYSIGGGTSPYIVTSSNTGVVTVSQPDASSFTIHGVTNGSANIVVRDNAGATVNVSVIVNSPALSLNPPSATTFIGLTNYSFIIGGVGPYTAVSTFGGVATVSIGTLDANGTFTANPNGNVLKIVANQAAAPDQIVVTDSLGSTASFAMTSSAGTLSEQLTPGELSISACYVGPIDLLLTGATGTVNVFSSDSTLLTVPLHPSGSLVTVTKAVKDLTGVVTITAIDSVGASAQSKITIVASTVSPCP